jgi:hypothetical protein
MQSFYRYNSFKNPMAAADVVNAVNALLEMGGDESLDLAAAGVAAAAPSSGEPSEESSALSLASRDKTSDEDALVDPHEVSDALHFIAIGE